VSAPTGSGKTLAYLVPLLSVLCHRVVPRLRALVNKGFTPKAVKVYEDRIRALIRSILVETMPEREFDFTERVSIELPMQILSDIMGTPLEDVFAMAGGFRNPVKAVQIGGPLGGIVPVDRIGQLTVDFESFKKEGFLLGHAGVVSIPEAMPMIEYLQHLFQFTADESCGKCFPCRLGSTRGKELIAKARAENDFKIDRELLTDLLDTMEQTSLCALGGGVPLPIKNALKYFEGELASYFSNQ
jgi:NADH:ubiquinone oxidoreductase subunit F (NADH-binding)